MTEFHKIETLYERDEATHRLKPELILKNRTYSLIKTWQWTEKIDGTNMRATWQWQSGTLTIGGKTDNAQIHPELFHNICGMLHDVNLRLVFPNVDAVLYGEGYGPGIQKGGGDYIDHKSFLLFDVLVDGKWWMNWENTVDIATKLGIQTVPYFGEMTLEYATNSVKSGFPSVLNNGKRRAEGLVGRTIEPLFDKKGARLIVKLKTKDF